MLKAIPCHDVIMKHLHGKQERYQQKTRGYDPNEPLIERNGTWVDRSEYGVTQQKTYFYTNYKASRERACKSGRRK